MLLSLYFYFFIHSTVKIWWTVLKENGTTSQSSFYHIDINPIMTWFALEPLNSDINFKLNYSIFLKKILVTKLVKKKLTYTE